jgi:hypothetical protein
MIKGGVSDLKSASFRSDYGVLDMAEPSVPMSFSREHNVELSSGITAFLWLKNSVSASSTAGAICSFFERS